MATRGHKKRHLLSSCSHWALLRPPVVSRAALSYHLDHSGFDERFKAAFGSSFELNELGDWVPSLHGQAGGPESAGVVSECGGDDPDLHGGQFWF